MSQTKVRAFLIVLILGSTGYANAAVVIDQQNPSGAVAFNATLLWQQEVIVGVGGILESVEIETLVPTTSMSTGVMDFFINVGSGWQTDAHDFSTTITMAGGGGVENYRVDTLSAGISLSPGDVFVFGVQGQTGIFASPRGTNMNAYAGDLYVNGVEFNVGQDFTFTSRMETTAVPEPSQLALLSFLLIGFQARRRWSRVE